MLTLLRESAKLLDSRKKTEKDTRPIYSNDVYTWDNTERSIHEAVSYGNRIYDILHLSTRAFMW